MSKSKEIEGSKYWARQILHLELKDLNGPEIVAGRRQTEYDTGSVRVCFTLINEAQVLCSERLKSCPGRPRRGIANERLKECFIKPSEKTVLEGFVELRHKSVSVVPKPPQLDVDFLNDRGLHAVEILQIS